MRSKDLHWLLMGICSVDSDTRQSNRKVFGLPAYHTLFPSSLLCSLLQSSIHMRSLLFWLSNVHWRPVAFSESPRPLAPDWHCKGISLMGWVTGPQPYGSRHFGLPIPNHPSHSNEFPFKIHEFIPPIPPENPKNDISQFF